MSNKLTPEEKEFLGDLHDFSQGTLNPESLQRIFLDNLYKLIDLRINPPKVSKLKTLEEYNSERYIIHSNKPRPNGIECPECKSELWDSDPETRLMSNPPKAKIECRQCNYIGYRIA